jgi:hypothetical protein
MYIFESKESKKGFIFLFSKLLVVTGLLHCTYSTMTYCPLLQCHLVVVWAGRFLTHCALFLVTNGDTDDCCQVDVDWEVSL